MQKTTATWHVAMCVCLVMAGIFGANQMLPAQSFYGSMVGTVTDATGAVVADASVTLINMGTSERKLALTDASGNYQFVNLVPGRYRIEITKSGFRRLTRDEIVHMQENRVTMRLDAKQEPAVRLINSVLFALLAGDLDQIEKLFEIDGYIHDNLWKVTLKAREPALAKALSNIALDGGAYVKNITISETSGDRNSILFSEIQTGEAAMTVDEAALF